MTKRIIAFALSVVLTMACFVFPASAEGLTATTKVSVDTAYRGDIITVTVVLSESVKARSGAITLTYDTTAFQIVTAPDPENEELTQPPLLEGFGWLGKISENSMLMNTDVVKNKCAFAFMNNTTVSDAEIYKLQLKVLDAAEFKSYDIMFEMQFLDAKSNVVECANVGGKITVACKHDYTAQNTDAKYLVQGATCTTLAKYNYSCAICGDKGTAEFEYGETLPHTNVQVVDAKYLVSSADCENAAVYYKSCSVCGAASDEPFTSGDALGHTYKQVVDAKYLKSKADCENAAVYYESCTVCGKQGGETFTHGNALGHTHKQVVDAKYLKSAADCENAAVYYESCEVCGKQGDETFVNGEKLGHTGGTATCTQKAVCTRCSKEYGETLPHTYDKQVVDAKYLNAEADCTHKATYFYSCVCGAKGEKTFEYGETASHNYVKQIVTKDYLKSEATCTAKAVYYYACSGCDLKGNVTYEYGEKLPHTFDKKVEDAKYLKSEATCTEAKTYFYSCACGEKSETTFTVGEALGHTGGTATCTQKAVCTRCEKEYGELLAHVYDQKKETEEYLKAAVSCTNKATYFYSCVCGAKGTETFEVGEKLPHTFDKQVADAKYLKSEATCTAKAVYYYSCACGEKGTETFEYGADPAHSYATKWAFSKDEHWHECTKCGDKKDVAAHTPGAAATEYTAQTCTVCSYIITPALGHNHSYSDKWTTNATHHWYECATCIVPSMRGEHVYDNACDATCNTCGYTRQVAHNYGAWKTDSSKHWHECSVCGFKADEAAHTPGAAATETTAQTCTVCSYVIKAALGHTHAYGDWAHNDTEHWKACACGNKSEVAAHTWDKGTVTKEITDQAEGEMTYTCTICGATKKEAITIGTADTTTTPDVTTEVPETTTVSEETTLAPETTPAPDTDAPKTEKGCGGFVALGMIACIIPAAIVVLKKREDK